MTADRRWKSLAGDTKAFLESAGRGDDLNRHLSLKVLRNGFTLNSSGNTSPEDRWKDKDFLLVNMGYHHFHLSPIVEAAGHAKRTDDVLFANVTRDEFKAIGFFDHSVFTRIDPDSQAMPAERERLWKIFDHRISMGVALGTVHVVNPITTSGHSLRLTMLASEFARVINL